MLCFPACLAANAQMKEGKVIYERTIQIQFRTMNPEMANNLPPERKDKFELSFAGNQSLWEALPDMEENGNEVSSTDGMGGRQVMRFGGPDEIIYYDIEKGKRVEQRELFSKNYIVEDSIRKLPWKMTGETKEILGHKVQKATAERYGFRQVMSMENGQMKREKQPDTTLITAWFAMDIPVAAGPEFGGQLPGLILELNMNKGRIVYQAMEISPKVSVASIKAPTKGKKITNDEFDKEREKAFEEMRKNSPPGMQIRIAN